MPRTKHNNAILFEVLKALRDVGDMTVSELIDLLDVDPTLFHVLIAKYKKRGYVRHSYKVETIQHYGPRMLYMYSVTNRGLNKLEWMEDNKAVWMCD